MKVGDLIKVKPFYAARLGDEFGFIPHPEAGKLGVMIEEFQHAVEAANPCQWRVFVGGEVHWLYLSELEVVDESR